jgi:putative transposase
MIGNSSKAMIHKAKPMLEEAEKLNINLIFLPPYSPDLNPIEFEWKDMKRVRFLSFEEVERNVKSLVERLMKENLRYVVSENFLI